MPDNTPVIQIIGRSEANHRLQNLLRRTGIKVSVFLAEAGNDPTISVFCELAPGDRLDRKALLAKPVVSIMGVDRIPAKCSLVSIEAGTNGNFIDLRIKPDQAYYLNLQEGTEHTLPAVWFVVVDTDDSRNELVNRRLGRNAQLRPPRRR